MSGPLNGDNQESAVTKPLLIFDLDETLIHATEKVIRNPADLEYDKYQVYIRPYCKSVLNALAGHFNLAIWSSAGDEYVAYLAEQIRPDSVNFTFVWGYSRCTVKYDLNICRHYALKNLKKVKRKGYSLSKMLIVDNTPAKVQANYGNAIYIKDFEGDEADTELLRLKDYLLSIRSTPDYRRIEKRNW